MRGEGAGGQVEAQGDLGGAAGHEVGESQGARPVARQVVEDVLHGDAELGVGFGTEAHGASEGGAEAAQFLVEHRFEVAGVPDVVGVAVPGARDGFEELFVVVVAHAEGGGADAARGEARDVARDDPRVGEADVGLAVADEQHAVEVAGPLVFGDLEAADAPALVEGGAAARRDVADEGLGALRALAAGRGGHDDLDVVVEGDDAEAVAVGEQAEGGEGDLPGGAELVAAHAAAAVDDEREVERRARRARGDLGGGGSFDADEDVEGLVGALDEGAPEGLEGDGGALGLGHGSRPSVRVDRTVRWRVAGWSKLI